MTSTVLYRKYRPQSFTEVIDQDQVVSALKQQIKDQTTAHAYLFFGGRGTGKTSVARILAKALKCSDKDLYEIDAASNTGVDDVRELRDGVRSLPFESPVKVYIIDEVHMLSKSAFNALLKTLEEPPAHVIFILATTELNKVPDTVISRCELHTFKEPSASVLVKLIKTISEKEGYEISEEACNLLADLGGHSFRDTLGVLQKVLTGTKGQKIDTAEVVALTGEPAKDLVLKFLTALLQGETEESLVVLKSSRRTKDDVKLFAKRVLDNLRLVMILKYAPKLKEDIKKSVPAETFLILETLTNHKNIVKVSAILKELLEAYDQIGTTYLPDLPLEMAIINISQKLNPPTHGN